MLTTSFFNETKRTTTKLKDLKKGEE